MGGLGTMEERSGLWSRPPVLAPLSSSISLSHWKAAWTLQISHCCGKLTSFLSLLWGWLTPSFPKARKKLITWFLVVQPVRKGGIGLTSLLANCTPRTKMSKGDQRQSNSGLQLAKSLTSRQTVIWANFLPKSDHDFNTRGKDSRVYCFLIYCCLLAIKCRKLC